MKKYNNFNMTLEECKIVFDHFDELVVVDEKGRVKYISEDVLKFIEYFDHVDMTNAVGKYIGEIHMVSRIPEVLTSGKGEDEYFYFAGGEINVARIMPLYKNECLIGAIDYDLFKTEKDFRRFTDKVMDYSLKGYISLSTTKELINYYESKKYKYTIGDIIGQSPAIMQLRKEIYKSSESDATVLITGETGCGKELVTHSIHSLSRRGTSNLTIINCAAIPESLVESELFGYEEGTFTGAARGGKTGKFEQANLGTIFLDEVDQLPMHIQPKLLRVLQEKEIERIGGTERIPIDVRVIAATNKNLKDLVAKGQFREDLYYRLNVIEIKIPPLRERKDDIRLLAEAYLQRMNHTMGRNITGISEDAVDILKSYDWPGNVRELYNILERVSINCSDDKLEIEHLDNFFIELYKKNKKQERNTPSSLEIIMNATEKDAIESALSYCKGNISKTAKLLNISRPTLYDKMKKHKISYNL